MIMGKCRCCVLKSPTDKFCHAIRTKHMFISLTTFLKMKIFWNKMESYDQAEWIIKDASQNLLSEQFQCTVWNGHNRALRCVIWIHILPTNAISIILWLHIYKKWRLYFLFKNLSLYVLKIGVIWSRKTCHYRRPAKYLSFRSEINEVLCGVVHHVGSWNLAYIEWRPFSTIIRINCTYSNYHYQIY